MSPPRCAVVDSIGRCLVSAVDPGRRHADEPKRQSRDQDSGSRQTSERPQRVASSDESTGPPAPPPLPPMRALPGAGVDGGWSLRPVPDLPGLLAQPLPDGQPAAPAVLPEILAQQAVEQLSLPAPVLHTSGVDRGFVGVPMWLWIDDGAAYTSPISATATAGAASVTATAQFSEVEWAMGPPGAIFRCAGPGTPWTGQEGASPDCGYTYQQRSLPDRTAGAGRWTITATSVWTVTWSGTSGGAPVVGEQVVRVPNRTTLAVSDVHVLVGGEGS